MGNTKHPLPISRDEKTGASIPQGYGVLKRQFIVRKRIDVTKPIYEQATKLQSEPPQNVVKPRTK